MFHIHGWDMQVFLKKKILQNYLNMSTSKHTAKVTSYINHVTQKQTYRSDLHQQ